MRLATTTPELFKAEDDYRVPPARNFIGAGTREVQKASHSMESALQQPDHQQVDAADGGSSPGLEVQTGTYSAQYGRIWRPPETL